MNDWVVLATLILIAAIFTAWTFARLREDKTDDNPDDDHDDILGI